MHLLTSRGDELNFEETLLFSKAPGAKGGKNILTEMDYSYKNITPSVDGKLIKIKYYLSVTARINRNFL